MNHSITDMCSSIYTFCLGKLDHSDNPRGYKEPCFNKTKFIPLSDRQLIHYTPSVEDYGVIRDNGG